MVNEYERARNGMGLKINGGKSKALVYQRGSCGKVKVSGEET